MRSMFVFLAVLAQLFLAGVSEAQTPVPNFEFCKKNCLADKDARDAACPSPDDYTTTQAQRDKCLHDSWLAYDKCMHDCPPPPKPESESTPMSY